MAKIKDAPAPESDHNPVCAASLGEQSSAQAPLSAQTLQARLTQLVEGVMTIRRSVKEPANILATFNRVDQERFLASVGFIQDTSLELAFNFCQFALPALRLIDERAWQPWVMRILELYDEGGVISAIATMQNIEHELQRIVRTSSSVAFEDVTRILEGFVTGLNGRSLKLVASEQTFTDTETLHVPPYISCYESRDKNFFLYKAIVVHLWAQGWFGTWSTNLARFEEDYADPKRALRIFHALETLRLDACIEYELPGIARELKTLRSKEHADIHDPLWKEAESLLKKPGSSVNDSLSLLSELYLRESKPPAVSYQGTLFPERVEETMARRIQREKAALRSRLADLAGEFQNTKRSQQENDGSKETHRNCRQKKFNIMNKREQAMPEGIRVELEYNGIPIAPPDDVQQMLDSILQDLGDLPEDYLVPAGHGAYRPGSHEKSNRETAAFSKENTYLYDEWDHLRQSYRKDWCQLRERPVHPRPTLFVEQTLRKHRGLLKHLHRTFEALREEERRLTRQTYGDDIDIDAIVESYTDLRLGMEASDRLFVRMRKQDRNVAVMFMVDMSGSTEGWINEMERESLVLLCESLETLGDRYAIFGFSGYTHKRCELFRVKGFDESYSAEVKARISGIKPQDYTRMGAAIRHLSGILQEIEARTKLLITLSDGRPDDQDGYRGTYGIEDTRKALIEAKYLGIHPFCITIDDEAMAYLPHMYGAVNFAVIDRVSKLPFKVSEIYRRITM